MASASTESARDSTSAFSVVYGWVFDSPALIKTFLKTLVCSGTNFKMPFPPNSPLHKKIEDPFQWTDVFSSLNADFFKGSFVLNYTLNGSTMRVAFGVNVTELLDEKSSLEIDDVTEMGDTGVLRFSAFSVVDIHKTTTALQSAGLYRPTEPEYNLLLDNKDSPFYLCKSEDSIDLVVHPTKKYKAFSVQPKVVNLVSALQIEEAYDDSDDEDDANDS
jgi:hypothetical protein